MNKDLALYGWSWPVLLICSILVACDNGRTTLPRELREYRYAIELSKLEFIKISASKSSTTLWDSKLRGKPYWPVEMAYPSDIEGNPLILLAQINFAQAPKLDSYPDKGILQFFISEEGRDHLWGMELRGPEVPDPEYFESLEPLREQKYFKVIFHGEVVEEAARLRNEFPDFTDAILPVNDEAKIDFAIGSEYVSAYDYRFRRYFGMDAYSFFAQFGSKERAIANQYIRYSEDWSPGKIGGYAYFVQQDPRQVAADSEDWVLLFQLDSSTLADGVEVMWGDVGVGNFHIKRSDLEDLNFGGVVYYWDNH